MSAPRPTCEDVAREALVERYLAGHLPADAAEAFEAHYLSCRRCQEELRLGAAIRHGLAVAPARRDSRRRWLRRGSAALGLAAVLAALLLIPRDRVREEITSLGGVIEPPIYLGVPVRAVAAPADSLFEAAMAAYAADRYDDAATGLAAALAAGTDSAPALFFRASSLLMLGRIREAERHYRQVIALGETPYAAEARFFLAKTLLRQGKVDAARAELERVGTRQDELGSWARALADSARARPSR